MKVENSAVANPVKLKSSSAAEESETPTTMGINDNRTLLVNSCW